MNHYKKYGIEDFVWDASFRQWVLAPTRENDVIWKDWIAENPEMSDKIEQAKTAIISLKVKEPEISHQEIEHIVQDTIAKTKSGKADSDQSVQFNSVPLYKNIWFKVAASLTLLLLIGILAKSGMERREAAAISDGQKTTASVGQTLVEKSNRTKHPMVLTLDDGSRITLAPASTLQYPQKFSGKIREVYLTGEAFFDISKDANRPFFVYANELVTKVLGTSFTIKAYRTAKEVTVEVKTGRVSVFTKADPERKSKMSDLELEGIVLSPNQKIIYARDQVRMVKTLVENPEIIVSKAQTPQFIFEDVPATEAFNAIGKAYGIDILYDEELFKDCPLTAILETQTLHEKLTIICKAIEANYEILDGQIIVHGRGCKN